ncbi:MAG: SDR family NAD(P)-dependent oxidoreductase [Actinobacteria bacterium]|jgi:NAD(P)-dependent dehydrogenase (short-subunit alcohol dehydrogenase family)|nr:MAG: SDR family NAD(P)-dependent oxidoreductase [Actinomycetota bacterium]
MPGIKDFAGKVVAVTGAANGIGREMARAFARRGARLVLADIDEAGLFTVEEELEEAGVTVYAQPVDVSLAAEVEAFCENVYREMGRVDVLCNNAGVAVAGDFEAMSREDLARVVDVNLWGVIHGCHYFYPRMIAQGGGGHIVNTASAGGLAPFMALAIYCCTKYGVVGLSETLRAEAAPHGIEVSVICPGVIATDIVLRSSIRSCTTRSSPERLVEITDRVLKLRGYTPDRVAAAAVRAVERNRAVVRVTPEAYLTDWAHRISRRAFDFATTNAARLARKVL